MMLGDAIIDENKWAAGQGCAMGGSTRTRMVPARCAPSAVFTPVSPQMFHIRDPPRRSPQAPHSRHTRWDQLWRDVCSVCMIAFPRCTHDLFDLRDLAQFEMRLDSIRGLRRNERSTHFWHSNGQSGRFYTSEGVRGGCLRWCFGGLAVQRLLLRLEFIHTTS